MGKFFPVLLAFVLNSSGIYIFRTPDHSNCFPYVSYVIFLLSIFFLLWDVPLNPYPSCFRRIFRWANLIIEFLVTALVMELIMSDFWLPLEDKFAPFPALTVDKLDRTLKSRSINLSCLTRLHNFLKSQRSLLTLSYLLSLFFLACIMHSTRVIDFTLLKCGAGYFIEDIKVRMTSFCTKLCNGNPSRSNSTPEKCAKARRGKCRKRRATDLEDSSVDSAETDSRSSYNSYTTYT